MKSAQRTILAMLRKLLPILLSASLVTAAQSPEAVNPNLLPKYGSGPKPQWQIDSDAAFLKSTDEEYHGDRIKASMDSALRGWQYLTHGDPDTAMRRFNQAWLLNSKNGTALWGMAAVEADRSKLEESLKLFAEAQPLIDSDSLNFSIDHARVLGLTGVRLNDEAALKDAFNLFEKIYKKAPQNTRNLKNWAVTLFETGNYSEAWAKVKLAEATPTSGQLDPKFLAALQEKMSRPND